MEQAPTAETGRYVRLSSLTSTTVKEEECVAEMIVRLGKPDVQSVAETVRTKASVRVEDAEGRARSPIAEGRGGPARLAAMSPSPKT